MKKVLLSLSMLAAVISANAQNQSVGSGGYDDFSTQGNSTDNPSGEFSQQFIVGSTTYTSGMFWYTDADHASEYTKTRSGGVMAIGVNKSNTYSVIGVGFGDDNGATSGGNDFTFNISGNKTLSIKAKASAPVVMAVQVEDVNGVKLEISGQNQTNGEKIKYQASLTTAYQTFTFNLADARLIDHSVGNADDPTNGYPCVNWPTDCPQTLATNNFDYTQVTKVNFLISGGTAYTGTVTFDEFKIGTSSQLGLGTTSAAANIASTKVFPNPTTGAFTAEIALKNNAAVTVILSDMMGKQISTKTVANGSASFETAGLANGMYTVTYVVDGTPAKTELVVVK